ncbi:hypothetical protein ABPG75_010218 [Micractinium tetrahymenae]
MSRPGTLPGWAAAPRELLGAIAAVLPIPDRFGTLPLVCRHFHATSQQYEIADLGILALFTTSTRLSAKACSHGGIAQRCACLTAWLQRHAGQLARLRCDLPLRWRWFQLSCRSSDKERRAVEVEVRPAVEAAMWNHRAAFSSLQLSNQNLEQALSAAAGQVPGGGLGACTALQSLEILDFTRSAAQLAALLRACAGQGRAAPPAPRLVWSLQEVDFHANWQLAPGTLSRLPLRRISLHGCNPADATLHERRQGGLPPSWAALAPTLQHLELTAGHSLVAIPLVVSTLSNLTSLRVGVSVSALPAWLSRLTSATAVCYLGLVGELLFDDAEEQVLGIPVHGATALDGIDPTPPEGRYLSRLQALQLDGAHVARLPDGLSAATGLSQLRIGNLSMNLDALWEQLAVMLPCWPLLKEVKMYEHNLMEEWDDEMLV